MSVHFEKIKIKDIKKETPECVSIAFDMPALLQKKFAYKHGQHITLRSYINGEEIRRSYSLCSSPLSNEWRIAVKKTEGGIFSTHANEKLNIGDELELMPPMGSFFTELNKANKKSYVFIAAGSGITPVISIIKTILATEANSSVTLVYSNKTRSSIIFKDELEALKNKYMQQLSVVYILTKEKTDAAISYGRIDKEKCELLFDKLIPINADEFFVCGPEEMIFTVKDFLQSKNVDEMKILFELFGKKKEKNIKPEEIKVEKTAASISNISIKLDGVSFDFELVDNGESILDAAMDKGIDLPYSCKGGMCCTCKAKLIEGKVEMDSHYGLEPHELEEGFILTCQSHPRTEKVVIDFDVK